MWRPSMWAGALTCVAVAAPAQTGPEAPAPAPAEIHGRVDLKEADGGLAPAEGTVVWVPLPGAAHPASGAFVQSRDKRFAPHVQAVPAGTTVAFPNVDPIYHNVFSRTEGNAFDLGLYRKGDSRSFRFLRPGLVRVYCNIHPDMAAYVMVLENAAFAVTGAAGTYRLPGLPPGRHTLRLWNERSGERSLTVDVAAGESRTEDAVLDATLKAVPHKNKYGKDYPPVAKDVDRY